ncbi:MAG TPA: HAMP domain-containing sensor histidine kinase [Gemmatimonadaceae bacterium]|nr:HAMP domain-containing sensor histidine kinase [Gemmatimonadaceae bacterium]
MLLPAVQSREHGRLLRFFRLLPAAIGVLLALLGGAVLAAWWGGYGASTGLRWLSANDAPMLPITALCFVVAGASLMISQRRDSRIATAVSRLLAIGVAAVGLFVLLDSALGWEVHIDLLWYRPAGGTAGQLAQKMAVNTAIGFILFGQGIMLLERDRRLNGLRSQVFATLLLIVAFLAVVGHIFDVRDFYSFQVLSGMPISTAIMLTLLGIGLLFSQLDRGIPALVVDEGAAGFVARRLLPGAVFVPFILTMLRFTGEQRGIFGPQLGASLGAVSQMVAFLLLIAWSARVLRDIDRRRGELFVLEREAHRASEKARAEAEAATHQAEAARAEAESANRAKGDFLAVMSHELRTPLAAIMGYQELLADGITGPVTEAQGQQLGRIKASARHLLSLIDEILTFTRLDAGRETVTPEPMDLDEALHTAAEIVEPLASAKRLELTIQSPGPGKVVESDPTKVRQILVNLLSNAIKFTDTGTVSAKACVTDQEFHLIVSDTGIGIQPEYLNKIFDPFWQVEQKATRRATGTGLGLTVSRRLANLLGGDVSVTSTPGEGSTFTVTLPIKAPRIVSISEERGASKLRVG